MCFLQNFPPCPVSQRAKSEHKKLPLGAHQLFLQCHEGFPLRSRALPVIEATTHRAHAANCSCPRGGEVGRTHCAAGSRATAWKCRNPQLLWGLPAYYTLSQKPFLLSWEHLALGFNPVICSCMQPVKPAFCQPAAAQHLPQGRLC